MTFQKSLKKFFTFEKKKFFLVTQTIINVIALNVHITHITSISSDILEKLNHFPKNRKKNRKLLL